MSDDPVLASAGPKPEIATPKKTNFALQLVTGPGGLADEAALAFIVLMACDVLGAFINTFWTAYHFPFLDLNAAAGSLLVFYQASIGARARIGNGA